MIFGSERLIARCFEARDIAAFVSMRNDPEVARYQPWEEYSHRDGMRLFEELSRQQLGAPGWFQFALEDRKTAEFIGDCAINILEHDRRMAEIGYSITRPLWNRGLATEAVLALCDHAFHAFGLHRITAAVDPRNIGSCRVLVKAGFTKEAHFRQSVWFKGNWADDAVYARLKQD